MSIDYTAFKVGYTTGDLFTLTGSTYTGYFNVFLGQPYVGRYTQQIQLDSKNTFKTDVYRNTLLFDRLVIDTLTLPYSLNECTIQPNEFVTSRVINDIFYKLNFNTLYIYSKLLISNNSIPINLTATLGVTDSDPNTLNWFTIDSTTITDFTNGKYAYLANTVGIKASLFNNENNFSLYACTSSAFYALTGDFNSQTITQIYSSALVRNDVNNVKTFTNITDFTVVGNDLFIIDSGSFELYRYNIEELQSINSFHRRIYISSAGGDYFGSNVLNVPKFITSNYIDKLLVYDVDTNRYVLLDYDFNYIKFATLTSKFETVLGLSFNPNYGLYYILTTKSSTLFLNIFDLDLNRQDKIQLSETLLPGEIIKSIEFSANDSNIFYIATTLRVIKKLISRPQNSIGTFTSENMSFARNSSGLNRSNVTGDYTGFVLVPSTNNYDVIFTSKKCGVLISKESTSYVSVLFNQNVNNYSFDNIALSKYQYVQGNYINVELFKIIKNVFFIKNQLIGNFSTTFALSGNAVETLSGNTVNTTDVLNGYNYLKNYDFLTVSNLNDFYIHENERVTPLAINRCLTKIYSLISTLLDQSQPLPTTIVNYPSANGVLYLS